LNPALEAEPKAVVGLYIRRSMTLTASALDPSQCNVVATHPSVIAANASSTFIPFNQDFDRLDILFFSLLKVVIVKEKIFLILPFLFRWELTHIVSTDEAGLWTTSLVNCQEALHLSCDVRRWDFCLIVYTIISNGSAVCFFWLGSS